MYETAKEKCCKFQSTGKSTYWPTNHNCKPDIINFFILNGISTNPVIEEVDDLSSDQTRIILTVNQTVITKLKPPTLVNNYTDWDG